MDRIDERAFREWSAQHLAPLVRFAFALTHDEGHAEDLVESALVRTLLAWPEVVTTGDPECFTRRTMVQELASRWRRPRATAETAVAMKRMPADAFAPADAELVERDRVWRELVDLHPHQRAVLVLRYYEDRSDAEVAAILDFRVDTVRNIAATAIETLRAGEIVDHRVSP